MAAWLRDLHGTSWLLLLCLAAGCGNGTSGTGGGQVADKIDVVLLIDTSSGLGVVGQALCDAIGSVRQGLEGEGVEVTIVARGISIHRKGEVNTDPLPICEGTPAPTIDDTLDTPGAAGEIDDDEDWGPGVMLLSDDFPGSNDAVKLIVVVVDEAPQDGNKNEVAVGPACDATDAAAIAAAIASAQGARVTVSVIFVRHDLGAGLESPEDCVVTHANLLVTESGGTTREVDEDDDSLGFVLDGIVRDALD